MALSLPLHISRLAGFLIITTVFFHGLETTPLTYKTGINPKTCCGRPICRCTHKKGAFCPFKNGKLRENQTDHQHHSGISKGSAKTTGSSHKFCHLKNDGPQKVTRDEARSDDLRNKLAEKRPFIKQAPCSSKKGNATGPFYSKEFYLFSNNHGPSYADITDAFLHERFIIFPLEDLRLDKPPQPGLLPIAV